MISVKEQEKIRLLMKIEERNLVNLKENYYICKKNYKFKSFLYDSTVFCWKLSVIQGTVHLVNDIYRSQRDKHKRRG